MKNRRGKTSTVQALLVERVHSHGLLVPIRRAGHGLPRHRVAAEVLGHDLPGVPGHDRPLVRRERRCVQRC